MRPHARVHGRGDQYGLVGRQQHGGGEIVGVAAGHPRDEVGSSRRDDDEVGITGEADVADLALVVEAEQVGQHPLVRQRADRQRRHEALAGSRDHRAHGDAALGKAPDQVEALVGGDAAADDEEDTFVGHCNTSSGWMDAQSTTSVAVGG